MRTGSGDAQFLLGDHLGSTTMILNYDGSSGAQDRGYKPWGEVRFGPDDYTTEYQYTGQYRDKLIGLYYYGARWYDANLSRWIQPETRAMWIEESESIKESTARLPVNMQRVCSL